MTNEPDTPFWVTTLFDRLDTMREEINDRLDRINGTVRRHDADIEILKQQTHLPESCQNVAELAERVSTLEQNNAVADALRRRVWRWAAAMGALVAGVTELVLAFVRR